MLSECKKVPFLFTRKATSHNSKENRKKERKNGMEIRESSQTQGAKKEIQKIVEKQRRFYQTEKTRSLEFRLKALTRLERYIKQYRLRLERALYDDLKKSSSEAYMTEIGMVLSELHDMKKNLPLWDKKKRVSSPLSQFPAKSYCIREPRGCVLIIAPWNYPVLLSLQPLIGAIAGGNCAIIKPSEYASNTSAILKEMLSVAFQEHYIAVVEGDAKESQQLLEHKFDYIFYTGGERVGKIVLEKAVPHLTPVTLELGGKSPCIVMESANLALSAKRIMFGKLLNAGQTCVAPDYVLVDEKVKDALIEEMKVAISEMYGKNPLTSKDYPAIINKKHYERLKGLIKEVDLLDQYRDCFLEDTLQIAPILLDAPSLKAKLMTEEIFGPILPIVSYSTLNEAKEFVAAKEKPLALYVFTEKKEEGRSLMEGLSFGGGCLNDVVMHLATSKLPFGGVGNSGMGSYHGKYSYETFTHKKGIMEKATWLDLKIRYAPYTDKKKKLVERFLG